MAAAAAVVFLLILFWPGGSADTVTWADVLEQLDRIRTVTAVIRSEISAFDDPVVTRQEKIYFKDPGRSRTESFGDTPGEPESVTVFNLEPGLAEILTLYPGRNEAELMTHTHRSDGPEPADRPVVDFVAESLRRLKRMTADEAIPVGERVIDGIATVGFEAPAHLFFGNDEGPAGDGLLRIWVDRGNAVPLSIELEFEDHPGRMVQTVISDIHWGVPLEDSLFDLTVPKDWRLSRTLIETADYDGALLSPQFTLEVGPSEMEPLTDAGDVVRVVRGEQITRTGTAAADMVQVTVELTRDAAQRLHGWYEEHPDQLLVARVNDAFTVIPHLENGHRHWLMIDVSRLDLTLTELETEYLVRH
jgi:outer membrane lipoprotein-sorting protein